MQGWLGDAAAALRDDRGATAIEYALLAALIAIGIVSLVAAAGDAVTGAYGSVEAALDAAGM